MASFDRAGCVAYVLEMTRTCVAFGQRPPGSEAEAQTQRLVQAELAGCCDGEVRIEPFQVAQKAFMGQHRVCAVLMLISAGLFWGSPYVALPFSLLALLVIVQEVLRYKQFIDPFFAKQTSYNVLGRQTPHGTLKRRVVLTGHPDAAYEWFFLYNFPKIFPIFVITSLLSMLGKVGLDLLGVGLLSFAPTTFAAWWGTLCQVQWLLLPGCVVGFLFTDFRHVSHGANDNLSGTWITVGIAKFLRAAGESLENTELVVLSAGSEEAGLRGAKAFVEAHPDFTRDVETIFLVVDTIRDLDHMMVYHRDLNGTVAHDPAVCRLLKDAGTACGRDLPYGSVFLGSSDGTAFTQAGWRAASLAAMDPAPADYYHNRRDTPDNMDGECIGVAIDVLLTAVREYDTHGLPA